MSRTVNKVILIANIGHEIECRYTPDGTPIANFNVATSEKYKDKKTGQIVENTEWHKITIAGQPAEFCALYLGKGRKVYVEGSLKTQRWVDKTGVERFTTYVKAFEIRPLDQFKESDATLTDDTPRAAHDDPIPF